MIETLPPQFQQMFQSALKSGMGQQVLKWDVKEFKEIKDARDFLIQEKPFFVNSFSHNDKICVFYAKMSG